jgi:hypothetical protein
MCQGKREVIRIFHEFNANSTTFLGVITALPAPRKKPRLGSRSPVTVKCLAYTGTNSTTSMFCYLKPYYNDPNKSYFEQLAEGVL